jgi:hypothetical protein
LKQARNKYEGEQKLGERFIQKVIEKSIEIKNYISRVDEKRSQSHGKKSNPFSYS